MAETTEDLMYKRIKNAIRHGFYPSGMRLIPASLAAEFGVSRMPVRQALRKLTVEGFVSSLPNRRLVVSKIDLAAMREIFEMRAVLEGLAIRLALENMNPDYKKILVNNLEIMERHMGNPACWNVLHRKFHEDIYHHCGSQMLLQQIFNLLTLVEPYMRMWISDTVFQQHALLGHREIIAAINNKPAEICEQVMRKHITNTIPDLNDIYCKQ